MKAIPRNRTSANHGPHPSRRQRARFWGLALLPIALLFVLFVAVLHARPTPAWRSALPDEPFRPERCTWFCHNHNCHHAPSLPAWLTSDKGAFGLTIHGLYALGSLFSKDRYLGYGAANLFVFCFLWPTTTYGLWLLGLRQREALKRARRRSDPDA
jgi:hypothetical protein